MRLQIFVLFLFITLKCAAQNTAFDKVIIIYGKGHNSWVIPGVYGTADRFEFVRSKTGGYKMNSYLKFEFSLNSDSAEVTDTIRAPFHKYRVSNKAINSLYAQFSITKPNFTSAFIRPFLKNPTKSEILAIAKKIDRSDMFEDDDRQELADLINPIKRFNKIDSFINLNRPDPRFETVVIDVGEDISVSFIKNKDTTIFNANLLQLLGQPVSKDRENRQNIDKQFVNLEVNVLLEGMLPISSDARKRIGINSLTEDYIKWYIDKVL